MVRIERGNVVLYVKEHEVPHYLSNGFSVTDDSGNIIQAAVPNNIGTLQRTYIEQKQKIADLEAQIEELTKKLAEKPAEKPAPKKKTTAKTTKE